MAMNGARRISAALGVLLVAAAAVGCTMAGETAQGGADGGGGGGGVDQSKAPAPRAREGFALGAVDAAGGGATGAFRSAAPLPGVGPAIIKTGDVVVAVPQSGLESSVQKAVQVAERLGGFVVSTSVDSEGARRGTVVVRVPSVRFGQALRELEGLGRVRNENVSGVDVSQEFVDLQARLRNWQAQEAVLLRLMDRARTVTDTIRVQGELSRVQLEIERLRGRLDYLEDQTELGTITATFVGAGPAPSRPTTLGRAWQQAVRGALEVVSFVIVGAGYLVPVAILAGLVALAVRGLRPRLTE
jgi:Domain of unknown function (DUF4349)